MSGASETAPANKPAAGADLVLWMLAGDRRQEVETRRVLGLSVAEANARREQAGGRYTRLRQLRSLGALLGREDLALLLRARLAEQLLGAESAGDLAALLRAFDKVPERAELQGAGTATGVMQNNQPDGNSMDCLDIATAVAEARRLLAEIEEEDSRAAPDELEPPELAEPPEGGMDGSRPGSPDAGAQQPQAQAQAGWR